MTPSLLVDITLIPARLGGLAAMVKALAVALLAIIIPVTLLQMNLQSTQATEKKSLPNYYAFTMRLVLVAAGLIAYNRLFGLLLKLSQVMGFAILSEEAWGNFLTATLRGSDSTFPTLSILFHSVSSIQEIVLFITSLLAITARDVVIMLQGCFLSLLYAFGPIALVCWISPSSSQITRGWLANSVQAAFWSFFLRLVVRVWLELAPMAGNLGRGMADDYLGILTVNLAFLIMVLGTPVLAAKLLSGENLAGMATAASSAVTLTALAGQMYRGGKFINAEAAKLKSAPWDQRRSYFHHPVAATMTALYQRSFGRRLDPDSESQAREGAPGRRSFPPNGAPSGKDNKA